MRRYVLHSAHAEPPAMPLVALGICGAILFVGAIVGAAVMVLGSLAAGGRYEGDGDGLDAQLGYGDDARQWYYDEGFSHNGTAANGEDHGHI